MTGFSVGINILICDFNTVGEETASLEKKSLSLSKKHVPFILSTEFCGAVIMSSDIVFSMKNSASVGW